MRNSKIKRIRRIAKRLAKTIETTYDYGEPAIYYSGNDIEISGGGLLRNGDRTKPGVPTVMQATCLKFITKSIKKGYKK